jgi:putative solute:sodium symporter small subunit
MPDLNARTHWIRTRKLMLLMLALWLLFSIVLPLSVGPLNRIIIPYLDLPLGSFMSTHGAFIVFVIGLFWFARRQDRIDRDHFVGDEGA